jgi:hypothetical protein
MSAISAPSASAHPKEEAPPDAIANAIMAPPVSLSVPGVILPRASAGRCERHPRSGCAAMSSNRPRSPKPNPRRSSGQNAIIASAGLGAVRATACTIPTNAHAPAVPTSTAIPRPVGMGMPR